MKLLSLQKRPDTAPTASNPAEHSTFVRLPRMLAVVVAIVCLAVYGNTLRNGFVYDDTLQVLDNSWIRDPRFIPEIFTSSVWSFKPEAAANYYRPMMHLLYMATYQMFGPASWAFHLVNVLFHTGSSVLIFFISLRILSFRTILRRSAAAFLAALLFALHPINTEPVSWVAALPELSYSFFFLLSFYLYLRYREGMPAAFWLSVTSFFAATLCKEPALTLPFILFAYDRLFPLPEPRSAATRQYVPFLAVSLAYLAMRFYALGGISPYGAHIQLSTFGYVINVFPLFAQYLLKLLLPVNLNAFHIFHAVSSLFEPKALISIIAAAAFVTLAAMAFKRNRAALFSLLVVAVPLLPALYIPAVGENAFAERYLYLPSFGFALLVVQTVSSKGAWRWDVPAPVVLAVLLCLSALYAAGTVDRNRVWENGTSFYTDIIKKSPEAYQMHYNLGMIHEEQGRLEQALVEYRSALRVKPDFVRAHNNLGICYVKQGLIDEAVNEFKTSLTIKPDDVLAYNNLGNAYSEQGRLAEAIEQFKIAVRLKPDYADAHYNLGNAYLKVGSLKRSAYEFAQVLKLNPGDAEARLALASLYARGL